MIRVLYCSLLLTIASAVQSAGRSFSVGDYVLPREGCRVLKDDAEVPLKGKVFPLVVMNISGSSIDVGYGTTTADQLVPLADAEDYFTERLRNDPRSLDALHLRGVTRHEQKRYADAVTDFTTALGIAPENV